MLSFLVGLIIGAVGAAIASFFIIRNNKKKFLELLEMDFEAELKKLEGDAKMELRKALDKVKAKL